MERTFYYIAYRKPRGKRKQYVGDGLVDAESLEEARNTVSMRYKCNKRLTYLKERITT